MTPEIKHALETIRDECRKHQMCSDECSLYIAGADETHLAGYCPIVEGNIRGSVSKCGRRKKDGRMD